MSAQQDAVVAGPTTVPELLARRALLEPERCAIDTVGGESVTFGSWQARSAAVAGALLNRGLRPGDPVVLVFAGVEWTGYAVAFCGVLRAGGVAVPCSRRLPPARLAHLVRDSGAVLVLHSGATTADASSLPELLTDVPSTTLAELESAGTGGEAVPMSPHDPAQILYTSGTTGVPKGVCATHANLTYDATSRRQRQRPLAHSTHFLHSFPIGTNAGQTMLLNALDAHPTAVVLPRFSPNRFARLIEERRIGSVFVVPAMAAELVRSPALANRDLSGVRLVGSTAAPLPPAVAVALTRAFPAARLVNYYTSTEAAPAQTAMAFDPRRPDALGRAVGGALMIADPDGRPVPPGQVGEVWLRAPFPRHYLADGSTGSGVNGADAAGGARGAGRRAGWVRMGDLGRLDEAGYLYLVDRRHDIVNSGAHKVSTLQVEAAAHEHSDVADAAAVALPHPVLGSVVGLAVVPRPGTPADRLSLAVLRAHLRGRLADHELPARLVVLDRLPRNEAGKVAKTELPPLFPDATGGRGYPDATGGRGYPDATGGRGYPDGAASTAE